MTTFALFALHCVFFRGKRRPERIRTARVGQAGPNGTWRVFEMCGSALSNTPPPPHSPLDSVDLSLPLQHCGETGGCGERTYLMAQECWLAASVPSENFISSGKEKKTKQPLCSSVTPFSLPPPAAHAHFRLSAAQPSPTRTQTSHGLEFISPLLPPPPGHLRHKEGRVGDICTLTGTC